MISPPACRAAGPPTASLYLNLASGSEAEPSASPAKSAPRLQPQGEPQGDGLSVKQPTRTNNRLRLFVGTRWINEETENPSTGWLTRLDSVESIRPRTDLLEFKRLNRT